MSIYEICPKCKKKGFHYNYGADPLDFCMNQAHEYECKYCGFFESQNERKIRIDKAE